MQFTINHVITLSPEVAGFLQTLFAGAAPKEGPKKPVKIAEKAQVESPQPTVRTTLEGPLSDPLPTVTIEQVREAVQKKTLEGKKEQVKAILTDVGVQKVTALQPEQFADFLSKVNDL
jgi:hypothetical protein